MVISRKLYSRLLLLVDTAALLLSFVLGLFLRHHDFMTMAKWRVDLYQGAIFIMLLILVVIYLFHRRYDDYIADMDPAENLVEVIKTWALLFALFVLYLFLSKEARLYSRKAFAYMLVLGVVFDYLFRMIYRRALKRRNIRITPRKNVLVVTESACAERVASELAMRGGNAIRVVGLALMDEDRTGETICGIPVTAGPDGLADTRFSMNYREAFLYLPDTDREKIHELVRFFEKVGIDVSLGLRYWGNDIRGNSMIGKTGEFASIRFPAMAERCKILGINFAVGTVDAAVMHVRGRLKELAGKYVTFSNVHTTVMSQEDEEYLKVQNGAAIKFPDGTPIAWQERRRGYPQAQRIAGPDFMEAMFRATMDGSVRHYFYGASEKTIENLKINLEERYPGMQVAGLYSPPFHELTEEEDEADIRRINEAAPDIIWVGLGAPKQEKWMAAHQNKVCGLMIGVGAGFDFHGDMIRRAPVWIQRLGMEWFYRLCQDPKRLFNRYFVTNFKFLWYLMTRRA